MNRASQQRLVICGSMSSYHDMLRIREDLAAHGIQCVLPDAEDPTVHSLTVAQYEEFKRRVSFAHIRRIRHPATIAVLVVNPDKHGISNYIGPNSFAEIAIAFAQRKRTYVYWGIPSMYRDELLAWDVLPLFGEICPIVTHVADVVRADSAQLSLLPRRRAKK